MHDVPRLYRDLTSILKNERIYKRRDKDEDDYVADAKFLDIKA